MAFNIGKAITNTVRGAAAVPQMTAELAAYLRSLDQQPAPDYSYAPDYGGAYTISAPVQTPATVLETSPEWKAYLNALGLEKTQFAADIERQRALAKSQLNYNLASLDPQFADQRRQISSSLESRGMSQSGEKARRIAENNAAKSRAQAGLQQNYDTTISGLESQLANKNIDLASRQAQQQATMIGQGYVSNPLAALDTPEFKAYVQQQQQGPDLTPLTSPAFLDFLKSKGVSV